VGLPIDSKKDRINTADLAENVEALMEAFPGLTLWVEPGRYLVSHAGVLLTSVADVEAQNRVLEEFRGPHHAVYVLTRSDEGAQVALREVVNEDLKGSLSEMERDDILVVTNAGGLNLRAAWNHDALQTHYLKARRICQVRL
jgi:hypothetical protein